MSVLTLHRWLKKKPHIESANKVAMQHKVAVTTATRMFREEGYVYNGETWVLQVEPTPTTVEEKKEKEEKLTISEDTLKRLTKQEDKSEAYLKESIEKYVHLGMYTEAMQQLFLLYALSKKPLPLVL